jgi:hypothetical protein
VSRPTELQSDEHGECGAEKRHDEPGHDVLDADDLVIGPEDVPGQEAAPVFKRRLERDATLRVLR